MLHGCCAPPVCGLLQYTLKVLCNVQTTEENRKGSSSGCIGPQATSFVAVSSFDLSDFVLFLSQVMVTNVTSLLKTVKAVEDEATRGTRALEATIECIKQELAVRMDGFWTED